MVRHVELGSRVRLVVGHEDVVRASLDGIDELRVIVVHRRAAAQHRLSRLVRCADGIDYGAFGALNRPRGEGVRRSRVGIDVGIKRKRHGAIVVASFRRRRIRRVGQIRVAARDVGHGVVAVVRIHRVEHHRSLAQTVLLDQVRRNLVDSNLCGPRALIVQPLVLALRHRARFKLVFIDPAQEQRVGALLLHIFIRRRRLDSDLQSIRHFACIATGVFQISEFVLRIRLHEHLLKSICEPRITGIIRIRTAHHLVSGIFASVNKSHLSNKMGLI